MKRNLYIISMMLVSSCVTMKHDGIADTTLDFRGCGPDLSYSAIKLTIPDKYSRSKVEDEHGFCEYRFTYSNGMIFYVSSNVFYGSSLNYQNRLAAGVVTYSQDRGVDEVIQNTGKEPDGKYWFERINRNYVIGYINNPDSAGIDNLIQEIVVLD